MSRIKFTKDDDSHEGGMMEEMNCISIKATKDTQDEALLKLLMTIACKVTGGPASAEGREVKAAIAALGHLASRDKKIFERVVMMITVSATALMDDSDLSPEALEAMPDFLRKMRDDLKESILEAKKNDAQEALRQKQAE